MRENNILKSLLKYICITISASFVFVIPAKADFDATAFIATIPTTAGSIWGDEIYYRNDRSAGIALKGDYTNDEWNIETDIQLSAGEWRVKKNGTGTIYGTSACSTTTDGKTYAQTGNPGDTLEGGKYCWCKMTGVSGTDGIEYIASGTLWTFIVDWDDVTIESCMGACSDLCGEHFIEAADTRSVMLSGATFSSSQSGTTNSSIKIATTKYVEDKFAPSVTELNTAISTVKSVVDNTIIQADRIGKLYTGKQTRPTDTCPDGAQCLLITEADGTLHWYPICNADGTVGTGGSSSSFDVSAFIAGILNYQGNDCPDDEDGAVCWGNEAYYRAGGSAGVAKVMNTSTWTETTSDIEISAGEWRVKKNGTGTIYGTSACSATDNGKSFAQAGNPETTIEGGLYLYCWCKMSRIEDTNGNGDDTDGALWILADVDGGSAYCANDCTMGCAGYFLSDSAFRSAILGVSN